MHKAGAWSLRIMDAGCVAQSGPANREQSEGRRADVAVVTPCREPQQREKPEHTHAKANTEASPDPEPTPLETCSFSTCHELPLRRLAHYGPRPSR